MSHIIGVQYVGKKPSQEDDVCKTGAVWTSAGQVLNFGAALAKRLLVHTDSFAEAAVDPAAKVYLTAGDQDRLRVQKPETPPVINLSLMGVEQLAMFARMEFNRVLQTEGKTEDAVRAEVHALMRSATLTEEGDRLQSAQQAMDEGRTALTFMATPEEAEAFRAGTVALALVPVEVELADGDGAAPSGGAAGATEPAGDGSAAAGGDEVPTLETLLAGLNRDELVDFAKQEGVEHHHKLGEDKLRALLFETLTERDRAAAEVAAGG